MLSSNPSLRKSGVPSVSTLHWGSDFCLIHRTRKELLEVLVPYFRAGLEGNELCIWVTSGELRAKETGKILGKTVPHFDEYVKGGQVEIVPSTRWLSRGGKSGKAILSKLDKAVRGGFDGLRLACEADAGPAGGKTPVRYGTDPVRGNNVIAGFAYPRDAFDALGLMEAVRHHRFALVRGAGGWEVIESTEAQAVRDDLKRSEEKLRSLFDNMSEGFAYHRIVLDRRGKPSDYIFLEVNDAFERLTGIKGKSVIGKRATVALPGIEKDPAGWIARYGKVALTGKPAQFEEYSELLGRWYSVSAFSPHKGYFAVTFSDITGRKRMEDALRRRAEELEHLVEVFPACVWVANDPECRRITGNRQASALTGTEVGSNVSQTAAARGEGIYLRQLDENGREYAAEDLPMQRAIALRKPVKDAVLDFRLADGRQAWLVGNAAPLFDDAGEIRGAVGAFLDMTDRKRMENVLHGTLRRFELLAETAGKLLRAPEPQKALESVCREVMAHLGCDVFFNYLSDEKTGMLRLNACSGIPAEEAARIEWLGYGVAVCGCVARDGRRIVADHISDSHDRRTDLVKSYGVRAYACHPLLGPGGKVIGTLSFGTRSRDTFSDDDLSLLKAVADQVAIAMNRMQDEAALRASIADKDILMRELAHRTKNNMQVIGSLLTLQAVGSSIPEFVSAASDTQDRIRAMALVHENLYRAGNIATLDFRDYLKDLIKSLLRAHHVSSGAVRSDLELDEIFLSIDTALPCGLIINELVSNSLKHAFRNGKSGTIFLSLRREGEGIQLRYRDDGPGLPADFDISRTRSLGLKLVHNLAVRQLRGTMEIRREPGTEFVFAFGVSAQTEQART